MSIECGWCERDMRGGHDSDCPVAPQNRLKTIRRLCDCLEASGIDSSAAMQAESVQTRREPCKHENRSEEKAGMDICDDCGLLNPADSRRDGLGWERGPDDPVGEGRTDKPCWNCGNYMEICICDTL
jgi:hypothetical protein